MSDTNLIQLVENDIHAFLKDNQELFFNERDFQMHLAVWLKNSHKYDNVYLEYYIPHETLKEYIWENELRLDIVVRKGKEYLPIELKYKHKGDKDVGKTLRRFGEDINANDGETFEIMKSQHAHGRGLYGFWKDVRRLEIIRNRYRHVVGGLVVFLTNDHIYWESTKKKSNYYNLGMQEGSHSCNKHWQRETPITKKRPSFKLANEYTIHWYDIPNDKIWYDIPNDKIKMRYCIATIKKTVTNKV